jgi:hypothetical protein
MDQQAKRRRNLLQNIAIILLTASAVMLFVQAQLYNLRSDTGYLSSLFSSGSVQKTQSVSGLTDLAMPVRVAVTGAYGRWADLSLTTISEDFSQPGNFLMEALGSAGAMRDCSVDDFRAALHTGADYGGSVYYDFDCALPMPLLAGLVGAEWSGDDFSARRMLLQADENEVRLFLWDGGNTCCVCSTALTPESLRELVMNYQLGSAWFAFDQPENYIHVAPFSLFSNQSASPPDLSVSSAITDSNAVLEALSFNPHTNFRYAESPGAEVVVEGDRTLGIRSDGQVSYQGSSGTLRIASTDEIPTETETVVGVYQLLNELLPTQSGADLFLQGFQSGGSSTTLRFGYQFNGLPIRFPDGAAAAEVTLEGSAITRLTLRVRQYAAENSAGVLLPLTQALSIARSYPGKELAVYYVDSGSAATAQWLAE